MAKYVDVQPLVDYFHDLFIKDNGVSTAQQTATVVDDMINVQTSISAGKAFVKFANKDFVFDPSSVPFTATADGGIITELHLFCRSFLLSLISPLLGRRYERMPDAAAEGARAYCMKFFGGGPVGGAILDTGKLWISPHWLPIPSPNPLEAVSASVEDPVSRLLYRWASETRDGENAKKGARLSADPYFALLAMEANSLVSTRAYKVQNLKDLKWHISMKHAGNDADDVVTRASTFTPDDSGPASWLSSAYEEGLGSGYVLAMLQLPRAFLYNKLLDRIKKEGEQYWFSSVAKDYELDISSDTTIDAVRLNTYDWKMTWLDSLRGVPMGAAKTLSAVRASPLGGILANPSFNTTYEKGACRVLQLSDNVRAWIRSDPNAPQAVRWVADVARSNLSEAWFPIGSESYFDLLLTKQ